MDQATSFLSALSRLETALARLEQASGNLNTTQDESAALSALEAERDLLHLKHRRLLQSCERTLTDLDALIASAQG